jgi:methylenetetrahydrofolate reductase (NADPH)
LAVVEKEAKAEDKGRAFFRELAAKQVAILKGVGYKGVYLGGRPSLPAVKQIMAKVESFGEDDWKDFAKELQYPLLDEFYYYEQDPQTRLSTPETNPKTLSSRSRVSRFGRSLTFSPAYGAGKTAHALAFGANAPGFTAGKLLYKSLDRAPGKIRSFAHALEQAGKFPLYGCHDCGDCSLPDIAYLCPESQCAKNQRNGPCGGTKDGQCEVLDKECIWSRAYKRLAASGDEQTMLERPVIYKNASLSGTSAWANTFLGRDHHSEGSPGNTSR